MRPLCLTMIVKNEAETIERCIASALGVGVSRYSIVDTGSTDGTVEKIRALVGDMPGEVHERPWVDFGHNRTEALQLVPAGFDLLVLDADMTVQALHPHAWPDGAEALDVPLLGDADDAGPISYLLPLILRGDVDWEYRGAAHEYLVRADGELGVRVPTEGWEVFHHGDGGSRADKLKRDRKLLKKAIDKGNEVARSTFYLAQTERMLGNLGKALILYTRRANLGGWVEECYVSLLYAGRLAIQLDEWDQALGLLWRAHDLHPGRAEALYEISGEARKRGEFTLAHLAASQAVEIPRPEGATLFLADWVYEYGCLFEFSVTSQRVGNFMEAAGTVAALLAQEDLPDAYRAACLSNRAEYGLPAAA